MSPGVSSRVPAIRVRAANDAPARAAGEYVLYWMIASRRPGWNFALDRSLEWSREMGKPLLVLEPLRCGYAWASVRLHAFVLRWMSDNAAAFGRAGVTYYPYVEPSPGEGKGLLEALSARACVAVTDEFPCFFLPRMVASAAGRVGVLLEQVDSNGLLPLRAAPRAFTTAYAFRRFLQKELPAHLLAAPRAEPLGRGAPARAAVVPGEILRRWPPADPGAIRDPRHSEGLPLDRSVPPAPNPGGTPAGTARLDRFVERDLGRYALDRNDLDAEATSGLSPYLHFGNVSAHQAFQAVASRESWDPGRISPKGRGAREGWWGMSAAAEAFLDQLVTWRELGFNACAHDPGYATFESLPSWARETLAKHAGDARPHLYSPEEFGRAETHDPLWNAAQRQLLREGRIHNYLRMLWGKKILEWSPSPGEALDVMVELNNRHALDGRDPNSYSGILWVLGKYDRPWGPSRPVFGSVRYMSSQSAARKLDVRGYLRRYAG